MKKTMLPLFLVIFVDGMGLGLLLPILNSIIVDPRIAFLAPSMSMAMRDFYYGLTIGIFMICWFFGAAFLGDLSDSIGRKKSLMICLLGTFLGYLFSALAIVCQSFSLLLIGRIVAGFCAGSQPIAQATIVDISTLENKARNIGLILLSGSLGFIFGPVLGGILSNQALLPLFGLATPMYFAAALALLNALLLQQFFQETFTCQEGAVRIRLHRALAMFYSAFKHQGIQKYSVVLLVMIFGWSNYFSFISLYLLQTYHYSAMVNSFFLAVMGLGFSIGCSYLLNLFTQRFELIPVTIVGLFVTAFFVGLTLVVPLEWVAWVATLCIGASLSVSYSVLLTIFSNQVSADEQGWVMGVTGSIMALCFGLTSILTGVIAKAGAMLPMMLSMLGLSVSALLLWCMDKRDDHKKIR